MGEVGLLISTQGLGGLLLIWGEKEPSKKRRMISQPWLDRFPDLNVGELPGAPALSWLSVGYKGGKGDGVRRKVTAWERSPSPP